MRAYQAAFSAICAPVRHSSSGVQEHLEAHLHSDSLKGARWIVSGRLPSMTPLHTHSGWMQKEEHLFRTGHLGNLVSCVSEVYALSSL